MGALYVGQCQQGCSQLRPGFAARHCEAPGWRLNTWASKDAVGLRTIGMSS